MAYEAAAEQVLALLADPDLPARCVAVAYRYFDLMGVGVPSYLNVYRRIEEKKRLIGSVSAIRV